MVAEDGHSMSKYPHYPNFLESRFGYGRETSVSFHTQLSIAREVDGKIVVFRVLVAEQFYVRPEDDHRVRAQAIKRFHISCAMALCYHKFDRMVSQDAFGISEPITPISFEMDVPSYFTVSPAKEKGSPREALALLGDEQRGGDAV